MHQFIHNHSSVLQYCTFYLLPCVCHSALHHWSSFTLSEILYTILPLAVDSLYHLHRLSPTGDEVPQLAPVSYSENMPQHKPPVWTTAQVNPPSLTDGCHLHGATQWCHLVWHCPLANVEKFTILLVQHHVYGCYMPCKLPFFWTPLI